jgi:predicted ABC-class ATPase
VSTVLVTGGGGDYLDVADTVVLMEDYAPRAATAEAREVADSHPTGRRVGDPDHPLRVGHRVPAAASFDPRTSSGKPRIRTRGADTVEFGAGELDLRAVEQLVDYGEARAVADMLREMGEMCGDGQTLRELCRTVVERVRREGLQLLEDAPELALPRPQEVMKAASRLRSLEVVEVRGADPAGGAGAE